MNLNRLVALVYRDMIIIRRSKWQLAQIVYFPLTNMLMWGFFAAYSKSFSAEAGLLLIVASLFWNFAYIAQSTVTMQLLEDMWQGSLKQLFLSGVSEVEYVTARMVTTTLVSLPLFVMMAVVAVVSGWNVAPVIAPTIALTLLTLLVSFGVATILISLIVILGRGAGFLAWAALQALIVLSAPFFPKEVFPGALQVVAKVMPYTYIFEAARGLAVGAPVSLLKASVVTAMYFLIAWPFYILCFRMARKNGKLVKLS